MKDKSSLVINRLKNLLRSGYSLSCSCSFGKDSTCVLILLLQAIKEMVEDGEHVPQCFLLTVDTRREMPQMSQYVLGAVANLQVFVARNRLPLEVIEVQPPISGRFTWTTLGRGKLPRYVGMSRDCAVDEKINPSQKILKQLEKQTSGKVIALVGSRVSESNARSINMNRFQMDEVTISIVDNLRTYAPISDWTIDDVWGLLVACRESEKRPPLFDTYLKNMDELMELYRAANEGTCGLIIGDKGNRTSCGSRFGCAWCCAHGSDPDKSLSSMIKEDPEAYGYMEGLLQFRNLLIAYRFDMSRRDFRGRHISDANYMKVTPDYFNGHTKRELYRYLLTLDAIEQERAARHEEAYYSGKIPLTPQNYLLTQPMFQFISWPDLIGIEFQWSLCRDFDEAAPAAKDWIDVHELGIRYHMPVVPEAARVPIPEHRWFDVSETEDVVGLFHPMEDGRPLKVAYSKELEVQEGAGFDYLTLVRENYYNLHKIDTSEMARIIIHRGYLRPRKADYMMYEAIAKRHDYIYRQIRRKKPITENVLTGEDKLMTVNEYLIENSIDNQTHNELLAELRIKELESQDQVDWLGVDSVLEMESTSKKTVMKKHDRVTGESVHMYTPMGQQSTLF